MKENLKLKRKNKGQKLVIQDGEYSDVGSDEDKMYESSLSK